MKVTHVTLNDVCRLLLWKFPILGTSVRRQLFGASPGAIVTLYVVGFDGSAIWTPMVDHVVVFEKA